MVRSGKTYIVPGHYRLDFLADTEVQAEDITQGDLSSSTCGCDSGNCRHTAKYLSVIVLSDLCSNSGGGDSISLPEQKAMVIFFRYYYCGDVAIGL